MSTGTPASLPWFHHLNYSPPRDVISPSDEEPSPSTAGECESTGSGLDFTLQIAQNVESDVAVVGESEEGSPSQSLAETGDDSASTLIQIEDGTQTEDQTEVATNDPDNSDQLVESENISQTDENEKDDSGESDPKLDESQQEAEWLEEMEGLPLNNNSILDGSRGALNSSMIIPRGFSERFSPSKAPPPPMMMRPATTPLLPQLIPNQGEIAPPISHRDPPPQYSVSSTAAGGTAGDSKKRAKESRGGREGTGRRLSREELRREQRLEAAVTLANLNLNSNSNSKRSRSADLPNGKVAGSVSAAGGKESRSGRSSGASTVVATVGSSAAGAATRSKSPDPIISAPKSADQTDTKVKGRDPVSVRKSSAGPPAAGLRSGGGEAGDEKRKRAGVGNRGEMKSGVSGRDGGGARRESGEMKMTTAAAAGSGKGNVASPNELSRSARATILIVDNLSDDETDKLIDLFFENSAADSPAIAVPRRESVSPTIVGSPSIPKNMRSLNLMPVLGVLSLIGQGITTLQGLGRRPGLKVLRIQFNFLSDFDQLGIQPDLTELNVESNLITSFRGLHPQPKLANLKIKGNPLCTHPHYKTSAALVLNTISVKLDGENFPKDLAIFLIKHKRLGDSVRRGFMYDGITRTDKEIIDLSRTGTRSAMSSGGATPRASHIPRSALSSPRLRSPPSLSDRSNLYRRAPASEPTKKLLASSPSLSSAGKTSVSKIVPPSPSRTAQSISRLSLSSPKRSPTSATPSPPSSTMAARLGDQVAAEVARARAVVQRIKNQNSPKFDPHKISTPSPKSLKSPIFPREDGATGPDENGLDIVIEETATPDTTPSKMPPSSPPSSPPQSLFAVPVPKHPPTPNKSFAEILSVTPCGEGEEGRPAPKFVTLKSENSLEDLLRSQTPTLPRRPSKK